MKIVEGAMTEDELRALIIRALQAEIDRIKAGAPLGTVDGYAYNIDGYEHDSVEAAARQARAFLDDDRDSANDDGWPETMPAWGVMVEVEYAKLIGTGADHSGRFGSIANYAMRPFDDATEPEILETECPRCERKDRFPPGSSCPCDDEPEIVCACPVTDAWACVRARYPGSDDPDDGPCECVCHDTEDDEDDDDGMPI